MLCHFCLFLGVFLGVFNNPVATLAHGFSGLVRVCDYDLYRRTRDCLLCIFVPPPKGRSHFTQLLTRAHFFGPCHCSYISFPCLAFRFHVAGDLNKTISFAVGVLTTSFARALLRLIHQSPSCPMQLSIF